MKKCRFYATLGAMALPFALNADFAAAQNAAQTPRTLYLYSASLGTAAANLNAAKTAPWGNGAVSNARDMDYEGAPVLSLTTRNQQEGVRFDLATPVDLEAYRASGFLRLRLRFQGDASSMGGRGMGEGGMPPWMTRTGDPRGMGNPGGMPPSLIPGMPQGVPGGTSAPRRNGPLTRPRTNANPQLKPTWQGAAQFGGALPPLGGFGGAPDGEGNFEGNSPQELRASQKTPITELGVTLLRENGVTMGRIPVNLETSEPDEGGWRLFVLPLKELTSTPNASGRVKSLILTSDVEDSFYLAQAALVIETGQMTVSVRPPSAVAGTQLAEIEVKPGPVTLIADVEAGAADPLIEWNFDADNAGDLPPAALSDPTAGNFGPERGGETTTPRMPTAPRIPRGLPTGPPGIPNDADGEAGAVPVGPRLDARGITATFTYPNEEQNYRVEVTVRDRSGQKQPVTASILVRVRG